MSSINLTEMAFLYSAARRIAEGGGLDSIITTIINQLAEQLGLEGGIFAIRREGSISLFNGKSNESPELYRESLERVIHRGMPFSQAGFSREKLISLAPGMTFIAVPLTQDGKTSGAIGAIKRGIANRDELEHEALFLQTVAELICGTLLTRLQQENSLSELQVENAELKRTIFRLEEQGRCATIIGESAAIRTVFREIAQVAPADSTVIIRGETGSGKELVARAIHEKSMYHSGPFVAINCGALPDTLLESELFGYEKGAFTGALTARGGRFEEADGGTLFLDEIGELSLDAQTRLLRVIQERVVQRIGGGKQVPVKVRLVCATNRDLEKALKDGLFREDLYYRINVFPIAVPSLRERPDDIPLLVEHFMTKAVHSHHSHGYAIDSEAMRALIDYSWPGNVRELANTIERATLVTPSGKIGIAHLPFHILPTMSEHPKPTSLDEKVAEFEKKLIFDALKECRGNQGKTALFLDTTKRILLYKINKYNIDTRLFRQKISDGR